MWTPEAVRIRFVEAAATERYLPTIRKPLANGYWPEFHYEQEDRAGWDQAAHDDHMAIWQGRGTAKADALSRYQECLSWTIERIANPDRRRLVWGFSFCRAYKREFGKWCEDRGLKKSTSYNRLNRVWDHLSFQFNHEGTLLREAAPYWVGHESPQMACSSGEMGPRADVVAAIPFTPSFRSEPSRDLLNTPEAVADFSKFLAERNAREAKRRARLGMDAA